MPINAQAALDAGAVNFGSTTSDNFASLFKADTTYRIANDYLGQDSAVIGITAEDNLLVNPQGLKDPHREWIVSYDNGHILEHVEPSGPPAPLPVLYANTNERHERAILGYAVEPFDFEAASEAPGVILHVWIKDQKTGLVWELAEGPVGPEYPLIMLRPKADNNPRQLWVFFNGA